MSRKAHAGPRRNIIQMTLGERTTILTNYHRLVLSTVARQCATRLCHLGYSERNQWLNNVLPKLQELEGWQCAQIWYRFSELCLQHDISPYDCSEPAVQVRKKLEQLCFSELRSSCLRKRTWRKPWDEYRDLAFKLQVENYGPIGFVEEEVTVQPDLALLSARAATVDLFWASKPSFRIAFYQIRCQQPPRVEEARNHMTRALLDTAQRWQMSQAMAEEPVVANVLADPKNAEHIQLVMAFHAAAAVRAVENIAQLAGYASRQPELLAHSQAYTQLSDRLDQLLDRERTSMNFWPASRWH